MLVFIKCKKLNTQHIMTTYLVCAYKFNLFLYIPILRFRTGFTSVQRVSNLPCLPITYLYTSLSTLFNNKSCDHNHRYHLHKFIICNVSKYSMYMLCVVFCFVSYHSSSRSYYSQCAAAATLQYLPTHVCFTIIFSLWIIL